MIPKRGAGGVGIQNGLRRGWQKRRQSLTGTHDAIAPVFVMTMTRVAAVTGTYPIVSLRSARTKETVPDKPLF